MKNVKKYKDGIIYNIITVNGSQARPARRKRTTQPSKYNPQFRGMQYYPPLPSYADYGMNRFNTGNSQNTNIQDQYLREKIRDLEGKLNPDNNLPMIEDLKEKVNELYDEQYNQKEYTNTAGKYLLDFERQINDRFEKIKAPYSFDDSAGAFAKTVNDNNFISQIGNDREDLEDFKNNDDEEEYKSPISTPVIRFKTNKLVNPRKFEESQQLTNESFFTSPIEEEEKAKSINIKKEPEKIEPIVEDVKEIEEEQEEEKETSIKLKPGRPTTQITSQKIKEYEKEYERLTGKEIKYVGYYNLSDKKKTAEEKYINVQNIFNKLKTEVKNLGGEVDKTDNIKSLENKKETLTSKLDNLKSLYKNVGGSDNDILESGNINDVETAYKLIKPKKKSTKKK
jgi:hypothetical protein